MHHDADAALEAYSMTKKLNVSEIFSQVDLPNGVVIVVLDRLGKGGQYSKEELARNVFRVEADGLIAWQVHSKFDADGDPFTRLHCEKGVVTAYRWDGVIYRIDVATGEATPLILAK
jgi:hypothetical protein